VKRLASALLAAAVLPGCFSALVSDQSIACTADDGCPAGYACDLNQQRCAKGMPAKDRCGRDADCPLGTVCVQAKCAMGCTETGDCGLHEACVNGACAAEGVCQDDSVCHTGERCDAMTHQCMKPPGTEKICNPCFEPRLCNSDSDCGNGVHCDRPNPMLYGVCQDCGAQGECLYTAGKAGTCSADTECNAGEVCIRYECTTDSYCQMIGGGSCGPGVDHPGLPRPSEVRNCTTGVCAVAYCAVTGCTPADGATPDSCPKGYYCFGIVQHTAAPCTSDAQCTAPRTCVQDNEQDPAKYCTCVADSECPMGTHCVNNACLDHHSCLPNVGLTCGDVRP
jgi:hypothetical protein